MEEDEYKATYNEIAEFRCEFEKSLTNKLSKCALSQHFNLADREGYSCISSEKSANCSKLLEKLRGGSRFLLKLQRVGEPLPHNMEIRVQTGGLQGLQKVLYPAMETPPVVEDIAATVSKAVAVFGDLDALPYSEIIQSIALTTVRKRRKNK